MTMSSDHRQMTIAAGEFKAKCLKLLDEVAESGRPLVITKHGRPVARLVALPDPKRPLFGALAGSVVEERDLVSPLPVAWHAAE